METRSREDYRKLYQDRLPIGQKFQDHCTYWIQKELNITIGNFQSKEYQFKFGENPQGVEIKHDMNFAKTGNLWIEVAHRVHTEQEYYAGGILRPDNSWLYAIGDYNIFYIFPVRYLKLLFERKQYPVIENHLCTSKGFLLPKEDAEKYCANKIETPEGCITDKEEAI